MTTKHTYALIWVGLGGFHADFHPGPWHKLPGGGRSREGAGNLSGYDLEPDAALAACLRSGGIVPDGTPVIDKREVLTADGGARLSFRSPMLNLDGRADVSPEEIARHPLMQAAAIAPELADGNAYVNLGAAAIAGAINLNGTDVAGYVDYWRKAGARIGAVQAGAIVWETPPADPQIAITWEASP